MNAIPSVVGTQVPRPLCVDDIIINEQLARRSARAAQYQLEVQALHTLMQKFCHSSCPFLDAVAESACGLCNAASAGISIEVTLPAGRKLVRWVATAGRAARWRDHAMPRESSLCGAALDRNRPLLLARPQRYFHEIDDRLYVEEALVVPWRAAEGAVGALWVMSHSPEKRFDAEDLRVLQSLSDFAQAAVVRERIEAERCRQRERKVADNLANLLAHQINNPLQTLTNILELLPGNAQEQFIREARDAVHRIAYLVRGVLLRQEAPC